MAYLIDTDVVIYHLDDQPGVTDLLSRLAEEGIFVSSVTYMEALEGILRSPNRRAAEERFADYLDIVGVIPFSLAEARRCAILRNELRGQGRRVRSRALDLLNAATALEHDLTFATRNRDDYWDIPGLSLY